MKDFGLWVPSRGRLFLAGSLLALAYLLASCSEVKFISDYDENTASAVIQLHGQVEQFLLKLEKTAGKPEGSHGVLEESYDHVRLALSDLHLRCAAREKNDLQVQQIDLISKNWDSLEQLHKLGLTAEQIPPLRTAFNVAFTAVLRLENAKKRGGQ